MNSIIPDPIEPEELAIDENGNLLGGVWTVPLDENGKPIGEQRHVSYAYGVRITPLDSTTKGHAHE